ncbi:hypothetical protein DPMN_024210 [Dreissena polymorpha]|uniref:Uncharacterized protein n=1 Tax=Dreissena polymorpha TaxID=45954 RepID=A0A9D4RBE2_DREPO|nr:hypothetical protein DPMN_024210 [Dreissena polymorpha]
MDGSRTSRGVTVPSTLNALGKPSRGWRRRLVTSEVAIKAAQYAGRMSVFDCLRSDDNDEV